MYKTRAAPPRTHDLFLIMQNIIGAEADLETELREACGVLNPYAVEVRYPVSPVTLDLSDAMEARNAAKMVADWALKQMPELQVGDRRIPPPGIHLVKFHRHVAKSGFIKGNAATAHQHVADCRDRDHDGHIADAGNSDRPDVLHGCGPVSFRKRKNRL